MSNDKKDKPFKFMVDNKPLESDDAMLTGAQIKARAGIDPTFGLFLEGKGKDADQSISDNQTVDLSEPGREHFYSAPPATYGTTK